MIPPIIHELEARSALNAVQGMPFKWSLNPYKGCGHGCGYCYARAYHSFLDLPPSSFKTQLFAKLNIAEVLRAELRKPSWEWDYVAVGTATDPYQPIEGQYRLTRKCLEALLEAENPGSVTTKGTLVTRDVVEREFPHLEAGYRRLYGPNTHAPTPYQLQVEGRVSAARRAEGLGAAPRGESERPRRQPQLALF